MELEVLCLQKYPEYIEQCVDLLNSQWPRSKTARLRTFDQGSTSGLPTSLVLIDKKYGNGKGKVLAHSKISPVPSSSDNMCFIESVVVAPELRGKGLGRLIMKETEAFVLSKGITTVYLTTHDQQAFYEKLGYALSEPVIVYGGRCQTLNKIVAMNMKDVKISDTESSKPKNSLMTQMSTSKSIIKCPTYSPKTLTNVPPPPPPPPLFRPSSTNPNIGTSNKNIEVLRGNDEIKVTMKKILR